MRKKVSVVTPCYNEQDNVEKLIRLVKEQFDILTLTLTFGGIFIATKLIDDFIMQPFIYSKSVKAHPLEIFLVILIAGEVGGILGMIIAIPLYTLIRIILKEFYSNSRFVQNFIKGI